MKKFTKILFLLFAISAFVMNGQNSNDFKLEHVEQGRIRIKIKKEYLQNGLAAKDLNVTNAKTAKVGISNIDQASSKVGIIRIKRVFPFSLKHEAKHREYGLHQWFELEFNEDIHPSIVLEQYQDLTEIALAKPVYKKVFVQDIGDPVKVSISNLKSSNKNANKSGVKVSTATQQAEFNDPMLSQQWHYSNDGSIGTAGADVDLLKAWTQSTGRKDIIVAIVDGGIDEDHEDLKDNLWINEAEVNGEEGVDDDQNGFVDDFHGTNFVIDGPITPHNHGTHVAGTVGAVSNNGIGVAGVAGGDGTGNGVQLMSCQVFDDRVQLSGNFAAAIVYGADNGAVISQNSWGYNQPNFYEPEVLDAVRYFKAEAGNYPGSPMKGGILFFAAGNDGLEQTHYPGSFEEVIAVTSLGPDGYPAPYTNRGEWTDIAAPGGNQSYFGREGGVLSTLTDNEYGFFQGTSMSCPHASGIAALVIAKFSEDGNFYADDLDFIMRNSVEPFGFDDQGKYGSGSINATYALADDGRIAPEKISDLHAMDIYHNAIQVGWTVPADEDNFQPNVFYLALSEEEITDANFDDATIFAFGNPFDAGTEVNVTVSGLLEKTEYYFAIKSADMFNNVSAISNVIKTSTTDAPSFMTSTRALEFNIDVTDDPIHTQNVTFSNEGEGNLLWENYILNERYYFQVQEKLTEKLKTRAEVSTLNASTTGSMPGFKPLSDAETKSVPSKPEFWEDDTTEYVAGMSYENGNYPVSLIGSRLVNGAVSFATRFFVSPTYTFNLTHIEAALYMETDEPVIIEIKKGGQSSINDAKTVHIQEFYPDTTNVFNLYRIPLHRPQRFEDGETFYVVMHHPKSHQNPLGVFLGERYLDHFLKSEDGGRTFFDYQPTYVASYYVPFLRALSTGNDGSYVFVSPGSGKIGEGEDMNVAFNVDATALTEGKHLASVNILSNDVHKALMNIEVKVNVTGQKPSFDNQEVREFGIVKNSVNELEIDLENIGLSELRIHEITSTDAGVVDILNDTVSIHPSFSKKFKFEYSTTATGVINVPLTLKTNFGDMILPTKMIVENAGELATTLSKNTFDIDAEETETFDITLENTGANENVKYSFDYNELTIAKNKIFVEDVEYTVTTSDDVGGPTANTWEDIKAFGYRNKSEYFYRDTLNIGMSFPLFNKTLNNSYAAKSGQIYFSSQIWSVESFGSDFNGRNAMVPLFFKDFTTKIDYYYFHDFGDRAIYTYSFSQGAYEETEMEGSIEFQIVLFRNGVIEYRYNRVDNIPAEIDYIIGLLGDNPTQDIRYKALNDDAKRVHDGMVIRFEPSHQVSMITDVSIANGLLTPGTSENIELKLDPSNFDLVEGLYTNYINIETNSETGFEKLPLTINVTGEPVFTAIDTLKFNTIVKDLSETGYLKVSNEGYGSGDISGITFTGSNFTTSESFPIAMTPRSNVIIPIEFIAGKVGVINEELVVSFENGTSKRVRLLGEGKTNPTFTTTLPSEITVNINGGETTEIPFTVTTTTTNVDLEYSFENGAFSRVGTDGEKRASEINIDNFKDLYGYTWRVSDENKTSFKWEDIQETGTIHDIKLDEQLGLKLNFEFPYYGETFDSIYVSKNGYVSVVKPTKDFSEYIFQKDDGIAGMIAPFWTSIVPPSDDKGVLILEEEDRVIVQWQDFKGEDVNRSGGAVTFQLELRADGAINFNYKDISRYGNIMKYGLESPDESEVLEEVKAYIMTWAMMGDSTTVSVNPPLNGQVLRSQTKNFKAELSAENIFRSGTVKDTIVFYNNNGAQPRIEVPVTLNVTGAPILKTVDSLNWYDIVFDPAETILTQSFKIKNRGYDPLNIDRITFSNLDGLTIFDIDGKTIVRNSSGELAKVITVNPWEEYVIKVAIPVNDFANVDGEINLQGDFTTHNISVIASIIESPGFTWDAEDQTYTTNSEELITYDFNITNTGKNTLKYDLIPAVIPSSDGDDEVYIEDVGAIEYEKPKAIKQLANDWKEEGDGIFTPMVSGARLAQNQRFVAPAGGFFITHIEHYTYLGKVGEYVKIQVYKGGDKPDEGELVYDQNFEIDKKVDKEWVSYPLAKPVTIEEGETFHIVVIPPIDAKYGGFDLTNDRELLTYSQGGVGYPNRPTGFMWLYMWEDGLSFIWKIRPTTAAGKSQWFSLDHLTGELIEGESRTVTATIDPKITGPGSFYGKVLASSNDVNNKNDEFEINLNVNGAPQFDFYPNKFQDTVKLKELESLTVNFKVSDPENDAITFEFKEKTNSIEHEFTVGDNNIAQLSIETDYESSGVYEWEVIITDAVGNKTTNNVLVEVVDKNRAPVFNEEFATIELNIADPNASFSISPSEMFSDPDGDSFQLLAGNYTPDIVDLAFGDYTIAINPLQEGTGFLVFGADDGKEDGFTIVGVYVIINNDPSAVPNGIGFDDFNLGAGEMLVSPNPVVDGNAQVNFSLLKKANVSIEIFDMMGRVLTGFTTDNVTEGQNMKQVNVSDLRTGVYICRILVNGQFYASEKIIIN